MQSNTETTTNSNAGQDNTEIKEAAGAKKEGGTFIKELPILATSILGAALLALGIGFSQPTGPQSKLQYTGDLWCVSNWIEERPYRQLPDGRPAKDPRLIGKEDWIVREQVAAKTKEEAEAKARANGHGLFEPSDADTLRGYLDQNNREAFTSHFNTGATVPGPCMGTGDVSAQTGRWLNEKINEQCGFSAGTSEYETVKKITVNLTTFSPNMTNNTCDADTGGPPETADGGRFAWQNGRTRWTKDGSNWSDFVFAQPTTDNIIPWGEIDSKAVVIPGFNNSQPIRIADHYAPGLHANENYLDLFVPCAEMSTVVKQLQTSGAYKGGGKYEIEIVDLTKPKPKAISSPEAKKTLPDGTECPDQPLSSGPSDGEDYRNTIAESFAEQLSARAVNQACMADEQSAQKIVEAAMKYAPNADGTTRYKYDESHSPGNDLMDCSEFTKTVLEQAKSAGANVVVPATSNANSQSSEGKLVHSIDINKFKTSNGTKLRTQADLPSLSLLRPGDLIFFGTSTSSPAEGVMYDSISVGHVGIYIGEGKYIHSTSSDKNPDRDSASSGNKFTDPPISAHTQGANYASYNGVKIDSLTDSYFSPQFYIMTHRFTKDAINCPTYTGVYGKAEGLGTTANPGGTSASPSFGDCHGSTLCHPEKKSHHNSINGYSNPPQGDAIDIGTNGWAYAAFDGVASQHYGGDRADLVGVRLKSLNGQVIADYYHVTPVKTGQVKAGDVIGKLYPLRGSDHIHFELSVNGQTVHGDPSQRGSESAYAKSLWANMKKVLGL